MCARPLAGDRAKRSVCLSNINAVISKRPQRGQKPQVEQKGKISLDLDFQ